MVTKSRRRVTPVEVEDADLGYEYLKAKWAAEDDEGSQSKRRVGRAMMVEILRAAMRWRKKE